jgi:hypothetical protein
VTAWLVLGGLLLLAGAVGLGAYLHWAHTRTPTEREQVLAAEIEALKAVNYLGAEFWNARESMRQEAQRPQAYGRATVGRAYVPGPRRAHGRATVGRPPGPVIDGDVIDDSRG